MMDATIRWPTILPALRRRRLFYPISVFPPSIRLIVHVSPLSECVLECVVDYTRLYMF